MSKPRIIKDYSKISDQIKEQIKLVYPRGYHKHLVPFSKMNGDKYLGLPFETEEAIYLIQMSKREAIQIVREDDDFDEAGNLKERKKELYEEKYDDVDYLDEYNTNEDNELGESIDPTADEFPDED